MPDDSIVEKLPLRFRQAVLQAGVEGVEEIRFRIGQPPELDYGDRRIRLHIRQEDGNGCVTEDSLAECCACKKGSAFVADKAEADRVTEADVRELLNYLTGYSLYAYENEIRQGYFTIPGGHRIGVAGRTSTSYSSGSRAGGYRYLNGSGENSLGHGISGVDASQQVTGIVDIASVNIRVAHEHKGCARQLMPYIRREIADIYNTLILASPGVGKTTYLRDCIRMLSNGERFVNGKVPVSQEMPADGEVIEKHVVQQLSPMKVAVVDERSEIAACYRGVPQNDVGSHTDVLDGCPKLQGMRMLLRSMSPQVIAVDELGDEADFLALYELMHSGIRILGTIHAGSVEELRSKLYLQQLLGTGRIERLILLRKDGSGQRTCRVYDSEENELAKQA